MSAPRWPAWVGGQPKQQLKAEDIHNWSQPESFRDVIDSLGEVDALQHYRHLGIFPGVGLLDPKVHHKDPVLKRRLLEI